MNAEALWLNEEVDRDFDGDAEIAEEVLANELGDFFSEEDVRSHADAWEAVTGRPLKRGYETWAAFKKRKKSFGATKLVDMDRATAAEFLAQILRVEDPTADQQKRAHGYEDILGRPHTDFAKRLAGEDAEKVALKRFEAIVGETLWPDRVKAVSKERDIHALNLVALRDQHEEVRKAAQARLIELSIR